MASSESKAFLKIRFLGEISNNWPNDLLGPKVYKTCQSCWELLLAMLEWTNTTSPIY